VLRPGALDPAALRRLAPNVTLAPAASAAGAPESAPRPSPGMSAKHYAPRARLVVARSRADAVGCAEAQRTAGERVALLVRGAPPAVGSGIDVCALEDAPAAYARGLFAALHAFDEAGIAVIVVEPVPDHDEAWHAIADRLQRASV
jgi:L-threonylcarbamoyladenylate synthase